ncbi:hypothetical protein [Cerasicoccus maritimus]|uniref:hypothetical protein n=1 Tax=Cerasicoccus maritimus TaxID=490089 RepID=UPI002852C390|nr:hypothetical protein [Cerasicoccus maritimus]
MLKRGGILGVGLLSAALSLPAQTKLSPLQRNIVIEESKVTQANLNDGRPIFISQPEVDYSGLRANPVDSSEDPLAKQIQAWFDEGSAAGNVGDVYENRDHNHSGLKLKRFGQFARIRYSPQLRDLGADYGAKLNMANDRPSIINASLAVQEKPYTRSMARGMLHNPELAPQLYSFYRLSDLIFYPEHHDYDKVDCFAVNTPYLTISQGSSGSDKPFMIAAAYTLASFHPAVKERLHQYGMLAPTVQMLLRWNLKGIGDAEHYLTGAAHPTVFDQSQIDPHAMTEMAHSLKANCLPPLAMIEMIEEKASVSGVDYFDNGASEILLDTPCAIGRIARSLDQQRTFRVSAKESMDIHQRPLTYHWVVLRGDPSRITITPSADGSEAEITVGYQRDVMVPDKPEMASHRVDIGVFVDNGTYFSAPAFISIWYPPNETRAYNADGQIESVIYNDPFKAGAGADHKLAYFKPWTDTYKYKNGQLTGWSRDMDNGEDYSFNALGQRVETSWFESDKIHSVSYEVSTDNEGRMLVEFE